MVRVYGLIVGAVDFRPVGIWIKDIQEKCVGYEVPTGAAFNIGHISCGRHQIEQVDDVQGRWHLEREVMQAGATTVGESHVMHATFALHPCGP